MKKRSRFASDEAKEWDQWGEKLEAALTPEEWEAKSYEGNEGSAHADAAPGWPFNHGELLAGTVCDCGSFTPKDRHALAALALHGQPFGFDWNDVLSLRSIQSLAREHVADCFKVDGHEPDIEDIIDRITALLPPREEG